MNFFFRTNFNNRVGLGHLIRILRLYSLLKRHHKCEIFIDKYDNSISHIAPNEIFKELYLKKKFKNQITDAKIFAKKINPSKNGYVIVDDYRLDIIWEKFISKEKKLKIVTLDDLNNRKHYSDFFINYDCRHYGQQNFDFSLNKKKSAKYLLGPKYCILPLNAIENKKRKNFFFTLTINFGGGGDLKTIRNFLNKLILKFKTKKNIRINVVLGPLSKNKNIILKLAQKNKNIIPIQKQKNLIQIYQNSDLFFGSAGTSVFETALVNLPSILISIAKNQDTDISYLEKIGHYIFLQKNCTKELDKLIELILINIKFYKRIRKLSETVQIKIDEKGTERIVKTICSKNLKVEKNFEKKIKLNTKKKLLIKGVTDSEINNYLKSRNLKINTNHSTNTEKIKSLDHYIWWFKTNRKSFVLMRDKKKILYFYEEKIFKIKNKEFYLSGWFACSKDCTIKEILFALNWQKNKKKNINWLSFIKKNNKLSIYLSKYLDWKIMKNNDAALQKLKLHYKIKSKNFIFYKR